MRKLSDLCFTLAIALAIFTGVVARAQLFTPPPFLPVKAVSYALPLDVSGIGTLYGAVGTVKLGASVANKCMVVMLVSSTVTSSQIGFNGNGGCDSTALNSFGCTAAHLCTISGTTNTGLKSVLNDQSGNSVDCSTDGNSTAYAPALILNAVNGHYALDMDDGGGTNTGHTAICTFGSSTPTGRGNTTGYSLLTIQTFGSPAALPGSMIGAADCTFSCNGFVQIGQTGTGTPPTVEAMSNSSSAVTGNSTALNGSYNVYHVIMATITNGKQQVWLDCVPATAGTAAFSTTSSMGYYDFGGYLQQFSQNQMAASIIAPVETDHILGQMAAGMASAYGMTAVAATCAAL